MASTSIKTEPALSRGSGDSLADRVSRRRPSGPAHPNEAFALAGSRRQLLEIIVLLGVIAVIQRRLGADGSGLPHPFAIPVLLSSCQYGLAGGMMAAVAASILYLFELAPQSGAEDFYAYGRAVVIQPAAWLATALVLGGLRSLHIHQYADVSEELAASRRRASDLSDGFQRAAAENAALERRIAADTGSVAALSRSLSQFDLTDRWTAAASFGKLFRHATGVVTFTVYLRIGDAYVPAFALEGDSPRTVNAMKPIPAATVAVLLMESRADPLAGTGSRPATRRRYVLAVPPSDCGDALAAVACELPPSHDLSLFFRRADDAARFFASILRSCPDPRLEIQP